MSQYVDSSALIKLYLDEPRTPDAAAILGGDLDWVTARHTWVEVRRALAGAGLEPAALAVGRSRFSSDWERMDVVELAAPVCDVAARFAEETGVRTLDALHLGAASLAGGGRLPFVTFDLRQAQAARSMGWTILGA